MPRKNAIAKRAAKLLCIRCLLCLLAAVPTMAQEAEDTQTFTERFYAKGLWRVENPVWNTWVNLDIECGYRVYEYAWAEHSGKDPARDYTLEPGDPLITIRVLDEGTYSVVDGGVFLQSKAAANTAPGTRRTFAGYFRLGETGFPLSRYYLESSSDCLYASTSFMPEAGARFKFFDQSVVSMKGAYARARRSIPLGADPGDEPSADEPRLTGFDNPNVIEEGWLVEVRASYRGTANDTESLWYYVCKDMYPQESFWGWAPADSLEIATNQP